MLVYDQVDHPHQNNNAPTQPNARPETEPYSSPHDQTLQCLDYLSCMPSFRIYTKAEPSFSLTIRDGKVILAQVDPSDPFQVMPCFVTLILFFDELWALVFSFYIVLVVLVNKFE